ncbi:3'-5' exonuclease [Paenibacillus sp. JX-17]|uniref:3'-5' exonuclease n=1 Tax=Paenibacillus lacisoli TaxID=3064525 RepID=A0ABT9CD26_9BACL|nr:3'-5' exonuclease [Paenibacillus sp. JX-17]MDO7907169.1 3'-5' exonuclease [Paenibacillus sp. JX-17]
MYYVIYDLEFTVSRNTRYSSEIIDIGAVKLTQENGVLVTVDTFQTFVRPSNRSVLSSDTVQFTGITQKDIDAAPLFPHAAVLFREWLAADAPYYLCAWGPDDRSKLLSHCRTHEVDASWICNTNDLQQQLSRSLSSEGTYRQIGLKQALELCGIEFDGRQHLALDDALNTAEVFKHYFDRFELERNEAELETGGSSLVYSSDDAEDDSSNPFGSLANLFKKD